MSFGTSGIDQSNYFGLPKDLFEQIFKEVSLTDNINCSSTCRAWHPIAQKQVKEKVIEHFQKSIQINAASFLSFYPGELAKFCPAYALKLNSLEAEKESLSVQDVYNRVNKLTEKYHVRIRNYGTFDFSSQADAQVGNKFVQFEYQPKKSTEIATIENKMIPWGEFPSMAIPEGKCFFPITLFNPNSVQTCFSLKGRLIELVLDAPIDDTNEKFRERIYHPESIYHPKHDALPEQPISKAKAKLLERLQSQGLINND